MRRAAIVSPLRTPVGAPRDRESLPHLVGSGDQLEEMTR